MSAELLQKALGVATACAISLVVIGLATGKTEYRLPLWVGYILRMTVGIGVYLLLGMYVPDARGYDREAWEFVTYHWAEGAAIETSVGKEGFALILAGIYAAIGHLPMAGIIMNATVGALVVPILAAAAERLGAPGRPAAWISALFPPLVFWGSLLLREALIWLCLAVIAWALAGMVRRVTVTDVFWLCAALVSMLWVRGTAAVLVGSAGLLALMLVRRQAGGVALGAGLLGLFLLTPVADRASRVVGRYDLDEINRSRAALTREATSGFDTGSYDGPYAVIEALPTMLPRVLAGPFPWEWPALHPLFAMDALAWLVLLFWVWRGRTVVGTRMALITIIPALTIALALAVTSGNYGTMQRLRLLSVVLLVPIAAAGVRPGRLDEFSQSEQVELAGTTKSQHLDATTRHDPLRKTVNRLF